MKRYFTWLKILVYIILLFVAKQSAAQTVTIKAVDTGPYTPGSSIAVLFSLDNTSGCLAKTNKFNLYLSDALGSFTNETLIGTFDGFTGGTSYGTFVNGVIPSNALPGALYQVRIKTTAPANTSAPSNIFNIAIGSAVTAAATSSVIDPAYPQIYGYCSVTADSNHSPNFQNASTSGTAVTATFNNELSGQPEGTIPFPTSNFITFQAQKANYTVLIKAVSTANNITTIGTKAYVLINNVSNSNFGSTSGGGVCLSGTSGATASYAVNLTSAVNGLQYNYPGTIYTINWGDGTTSEFTYCQIVAQNGVFSHTFMASSCGQKAGSVITNVYQISFTGKSPYCGAGQPFFTTQAVLTPPTNSFTGPTFACTNNAVTFANTSYPGQSTNTTTSTCADANATYSWFVDGVQQAAGLKLATKFVYTFTTHGDHTVELRLENSASGCVPNNLPPFHICVQDAPQPAFTLNAHTICVPGQVAVTDNSKVDDVCSTAYTYLWTVTPATGFTYAPGTTKNSKEPVFNFTTKGKYAIQLQITAPSSACAAKTVVDTVYANAVPQVALSRDFAICGSNQNLRFGPEAGSTHVTYSGTYQLQPDTYTWTVTPPAGAGAATFVAGTTANSQSPTINFPDFGTYTVSVTQKNSCGNTATVSQNITFQNAPTVSAGADQTICPDQPAILAASVTNNPASISGAPTWSGGTASGFSDPNNANTTYTPTAAEVNAGSVTLTVTYPTNLLGTCSTVSDQVIISFHPFNTVTSAASRGVCSGSPLSYQITSTIAGSTFTWAATGSANASGYTASGSGDINEAALTNTDATTNATVTYIITPHANGCDGTPFTYTVTIVPQPVISANGPGAICSNNQANIQLRSNVTNTTYTWTATTSDPANVIGFSNVSTPATVTAIQDVLINTGASAATVTYIISSANGASTDNCPGNTQTVTITVQPAPPTANAGPDASLCNTNTYQLKGNDLGPNGHGLWTLQSGQTGVQIDNPTQYNTNVSGLVADQNYTFRWTSSGTLPCNDSYDEVTIYDVLSNVKADFTTDKTTGCDATTINFTNTSTPPAGLNYAWDFGNGLTSNLMNPQAVTFVPQTNGKDSVYTVKLIVSNSCTTDTKTSTITIKPQTPVVQIAPDRTLGCVPFVVNVENLSPGTNDTYTYYLTDANGTVIQNPVRTDKDPQQFTITTVGTYKVYMKGQSKCGVATTEIYTLVVSPATITPRLTINGTDGTGCAPYTITFHNNTTGASAFSYDFGDGTPALTTTSTGDVNHTFLKGGNYTVIQHSINSCTPDVTTIPIVIHVLAQPTLAIGANVTNGCKKLDVQFSNSSTDPSVSQTGDLTYDWDFGDGSAHSSAVNPAHHYGFAGSPFTVTLTATNGTGCSSVLVTKDMITVNSSSLTDFYARPDSVVNIPVYSFSFVDQTTGGPLTWHWDFGDGTVSTQKSPDHTYADTGLYKVTLTTANAYCDSTKSHFVRITGVPGQVYLPNAIMPNSVTPELRTFFAKGSGLKIWHLQIFNNYGQLIYDTTDLDEKGAPTGRWDGTFKGSPVPQGVYVWQASGTFINGNEWKGMSFNSDGSAPKRTGVIHLLR